MLWTDYLNKFQPMMEGEGEGGSGAGAGGDDTAAGGDGNDTIEGGDGGDGNKSLISGGTEGEGGEPPAEPLTAESFTIPEGMPEGTEFDTEQLEAFVGIMNNNELSRQELGQALVDMQFKTMQAAMEAAATEGNQAWEQTLNEWVSQSEALPEIGGDNLQQSLAQIKNGLIQLGATEATFQALDLTGAGSHPEVVKILFAATKGLSEGGVVSGAPSKEPLTQADKMFGATQKE